MSAYDEAGHLAGEYTAAGALIQETVWLGDIPVATLRPDGIGGVIVYYVHADHLNTPRLVTDTSNNIRWRWDSDPFGTTIPNVNPSGLGVFDYNLRFPGQQYDPVVGLHYNYFRDYDPASGRYVQSDPIGIDGGLNTYAYADGDSLSKVDPTGENPVAIGRVVGQAAIRICSRIQKCKALLLPLLNRAAQVCKNVTCSVRFDKKGHPFPLPNGRYELCMHWQIDCHIKGEPGSGFSIHSRLPICWKPGDAFPPARPPAALP